MLTKSMELKRKEEKTAVKKASSAAPPIPTLVSAMAMRMQKKLKKQRGYGASALVVRTPQDCDILFGRGGVSNNAEGNRRYQKVIEHWSVCYGTLEGRKAKTQLAWNIYHQLKEEGFRFLKKDKGSQYWTEADETDCRKKISQRLRERALEVKDGASGNTKTPKISQPAAVGNKTKQEKKSEADVEASPLPKEVDNADDLLDDVSIISLQQESDDSIESLIDFADDFPISWIPPTTSTFCSFPMDLLLAPVTPDIIFS